MATTLDNVRYWDTTASDFEYPETNPNDPLYYSAIANRPNTGICVSGGGSVSASLIAGYYAALTDLNLMQNVRYISGVSGGTWGSAPYVYYPQEDASNFFGGPTMPGDITTENMVEVLPGSMAYAASNADIVDAALGFLKDDPLHPNRSYEEAVGSIFLNNFGIESPSQGNNNPMYFSSDAAAVTNVTSRNTALSSTQFMTMAQDRPFLIMNATIFVPNGKEPDIILPFEITPLYCGVKAVQSQAPGINGQVIGGFYVESFGFNTTAKTVAINGALQADVDMPFELCQPVGASGSALEEWAEANFPPLLSCFPQFNYWNPKEPTDKAPATNLYDFGDGGCIEDTGVTALLARGVENIAMFLTEPVLFYPNNCQVEPSSPLFAELAFGYNQIAELFGDQPIDVAASQNANAIVLNPANPQTQVFDDTNSSNNFQAVLTALYNAKTQGNPTTGGPVMTEPMTMNVLANSFFGINNAYEATVVWSVVDTCDSWIKALSSDVTTAMTNAAPEFTDFPEVQVFQQNPKTVIKLTPGQTDMLTNLAYWMVMTNQSYFNTIFAPAAAKAKEAESVEAAEA